MTLSYEAQLVFMTVINAISLLLIFRLFARKRRSFRQDVLRSAFIAIVVSTFFYTLWRG